MVKGTGRKSFLKNLLKSLLLLSLSTVAALLLGEIIIRTFAPQQLIYDAVGLWRGAPKIKCLHVENLNTIVNGGEGPHHFVTDENGYRINYSQNQVNDEKSPDITILGIGDSFLEAVSVENEETVPEVLARELSQKYHLKVAAVNGGVASWDPNQYYLQTVRSLALRKYQLGLIFLYIGNDCIAAIDTAEAPPRSATRSRGEVKGWRAAYKWTMNKIIIPFKSYGERRSHLFILFKHQAYNFFSRMGRTMGYLAPVHHARDRDSKVWEVTTQLCELIAREFARYNTPVIFVPLPTIYQTTPKIFYDYLKLLKIDPDSMDLDQPNKILATTFQERSLMWVDPLPYMRSQDSQGIALFGKMDRHLNPAGHKAVAEFILPYVEKVLKLSPDTTSTVLTK